MTSVPGWVWTNALFFVGAAIYLWWRTVVQASTRGTAPRRIGTIVFGLLAASAPVALLGQYLLPMGFQRVVGWPAWVGYTFVIFAGCTAVVVEPVRVVRWWLRRRPTAAAVGPLPTPVVTTPVTTPVTVKTAHRLSRRELADRVFALGTLTTGFWITGVGMIEALGQPRIRTRTLPIRSLPAEAVGIRIALISDLHVGSLTTHDDCRRIVDLVNAQKPDIICLAGDFSDGSAHELGADLLPLADLRPTVGTYFVTGDHEFYFDVDSWLEFFPTIGVRVLANESVQVRGLMVAGTSDFQGESSGRGPDLDKALQGRGEAQPAVLISHNPAILDDAIAHDVDLLLSGHTHGGQFYPAAWFVGATTRTLSGYYRFGNTQVFVTNGCRFSGPVARLDAPMDITVLKLIRKR